MSRVNLGFIVDVDPDTDPTKLQLTLAPMLEDLGIQVVSFSAASEDPEWTGFGVIKGQPSKRWHEVVQAADQKEAEAMLTASKEPRSVAAILPGRIEPPSDHGPA